jgi:AcrR family transcriptional regulator
VTVVTRVDAQRNRARLLAAARELLAAEGAEASLREVARAAGVGVGTLYRHFPTRDELVDAVLDEALEEFVGAARKALDADDPWAGFTGFLDDALQLMARNRGLRDVIETGTLGRERAAAVRVRIGELIAELVARAQAAGSLRADFAAPDVAAILWSGDRVLELGDAASWRRHLGFLLDGLRA